MDSGARLHAFLLLRYTLIIATAYLLLVEQDFATPSLLAGGLIALALATNVAFAQLPRRFTDSTRFAVAVIIYDTAWVTAALMSSGKFSADFFVLYFFLLLLAAVGENLRLIAVAACVVCGAYLFGHSLTGGGDPWTSPSLIRIPFLFTTAIFYGHLVERARREQQRADSAEALNAQLQRTLAEFKILYAKAQEAERIKTEFLATVSHELRTPLTTLLGYTELLIDDSYGPTTGEQRGALHKVRASGRILQQAIGRMLDASRIDFGYEELRCDEFELADLLAELRAGLPDTPEVAVCWPDTAGLPTLRTDEEKLRTILRNLLENACKYTRRGMITVDARWNRRRDELEIDVSDTGVGIEPAEIDAIFEAFRQGGNRGDLATAGVGLGLYIVQRLASRLGGEVQVCSTPGYGSTFTVTIPRLLHRGAAVAAGEPISLAG
ncbi:HAMP domain-containing histidine kinase [bacterium]|nr:HAMP domain-containing histidine kinase [bacterium]